MIVSQVLLDFVNALARFAFIKHKEQPHYLFFLNGYHQKMSSRFMKDGLQSGVRLSICGKSYGILHFPVLQRGSLDTQGEIRGGLVAR